MSSSRSVARTQEFQREQQHWKATQLQRSIDGFERLSADLELVIREEEKRTQNFDPMHVAYSTLASTTRLRRDNLQSSCDELKLELQCLHASLEEAAEHSEPA